MYLQPMTYMTIDEIFGAGAGGFGVSRTWLFGVSRTRLVAYISLQSPVPSVFISAIGGKTISDRPC